MHFNDRLARRNQIILPVQTKNERKALWYLKKGTPAVVLIGPTKTVIILTYEKRESHNGSKLTATRHYVKR